MSATDRRRKLVIFDGKPCTGCGSEKPLSDFYKNKSRESGFSDYCKSCANAATVRSRTGTPEKAEVQRFKDRQRYARDPLRTRAYNLMKLYGLSIEEFNRRVEAQGGLCMICGRPPRGKKSLHVDHDHDSNILRDLLCSQCNTGIGYFDENPELLSAAIAYLKRWGK